MTHVGFLWLLGSVTVLCGLVVVGMLAARFRVSRRRERARLSPPMATVVRAVDVRVFNDFIGNVSQAHVEMELEAAAICPTCGARYARERKVCARDSSTLAALH